MPVTSSAQLYTSNLEELLPMIVESELCWVKSDDYGRHPPLPHVPLKCSQHQRNADHVRQKSDSATHEAVSNDFMKNMQYSIQHSFY